MTRIPVLNGVSASKIFLPLGLWDTFEDFLAYRLPTISKSAWQSRMAKGLVLSQDGTPIYANTRYLGNQTIYYYREFPNEWVIPFKEKILYQDDNFIVADKPHFLPVTPSGKYVNETLLVRLRKKLGIDTLSPIHRIDRETAGLVLFSVTPKVRDAYQKLFRSNAVTKHYEAIAPYKPMDFPVHYSSRLQEKSNTFMQMQTIEGTPNAHTIINIIEQKGHLARYELNPITGKKHQLRIQLATLGIPIINDRIYPVLQPEAATENERNNEYNNPLQLIAKSIAFTDPFSGKKHHFISQFLTHWPL